MKTRSRIAAIGLTAAVGIGSVAVLPAAASQRAKGPTAITLHFFEKTESTTLVDSGGKPVTAEPAPGNRLDSTNLDYIGSHSHHAKRWTASDHVNCTVTGDSSAQCSGQFAIGGSLIYTDVFTLQLGPNPVMAPIAGGTGAYAGMIGTLTSKDVGVSGNSDVVITLHKK